MKTIKYKKTTTPNKLAKQIEQFEQDNPAIAKAMKTLDISMAQYEHVLRSLEPTKIYTSNTTKVLE